MYLVLGVIFRVILWRRRRRRRYFAATNYRTTRIRILHEKLCSQYLPRRGTI